MGLRPITGKFQTFSPKSSVCRRFHTKSLELTCFHQTGMSQAFSPRTWKFRQNQRSDVFAAKRSKFGKFQTFSIKGGRFGMFWAKLRVWTFLDESVREVSGRRPGGVREASGRRPGGVREASGTCPEAVQTGKIPRIGRTTPKVASSSKKKPKDKKKRLLRFGTPIKCQKRQKPDFWASIHYKKPRSAKKTGSVILPCRSAQKHPKTGFFLAFAHNPRKDFFHFHDKKNQKQPKNGIFTFLHQPSNKKKKELNIVASNLQKHQNLDSYVIAAFAAT